MDIPEPTEEDLRDKVEDLLIALTREERLFELEFASTPVAFRSILSGFSEIAELALFGTVAGQGIVNRVGDAEGYELAVLAHAVGVIGYPEAIPAIAAKVAQFDDDETFSLSEEIVLSTLELLRGSVVTDRKSLLIQEAREILDRG